MNNMLKKASNILQKTEHCTLALLNEDGSPNASTISLIKAQGFYTLYFSSGTQGRKAQRIRKDNRASVCVKSGMDNITLRGTISVSEEPGLKQDLWLDWFIEHFPEGPKDPNYALFIFRTEYIDLWIDGESGEAQMKDLLEVQSHCGGLCNLCSYREPCNCKGCFACGGKPFWGVCPVAACCQDKGYRHCGQCPDSPCELLDRFYREEKQGDKPYGARLDMIRKWAELEADTSH